jgi:hypothetical protein
VPSSRYTEVAAYDGWISGDGKGRKWVGLFS